MATSYSKFTIEDVENLGVSIVRKKLFEQPIAPILPSDLLTQILEINLPNPMATEKAKSEMIVFPILSELSRRNPENLTVYSGYNFDVNKSLGLKGHVDFILSKSPAYPIIKSPVFCVVEAKNDNLDIRVPQCIAEMFAAHAFNQMKGNPTEIIFGAVTFGLAWQFLRLENNNCIHDTDIFYLNDLPKLLGVLQHIVDFYK